MDSPLTVEELVREFDEPDLTGWKLFSQSPGLTIYRRPNEVCFNYKIKISTFFLNSFFRKYFIINVSVIFLIYHQKFVIK
jgi:hypothetical protein